MRDFLLHLFTITVGLLIALGLEGMVEWQHHRHLAREASESIHREIADNARGLDDALNDLHQQQALLKKDVKTLTYISTHGQAPEHSNITVTFHIHTYNDVAWRTAQASNALAYMPYDEAQRDADIYATQEELNDAERQAARDAVMSFGPLIDSDESENEKDPTNGEAKGVSDHIEILQGQLVLVDNLFQSLDRHYKQYLAVDRDAH